MLSVCYVVLRASPTSNYHPVKITVEWWGLPVCYTDGQPLQTGVHSDVVNSVAWGRGNTVLYSGSSDHQVVEWNRESGTCMRYGYSHIDMFTMLHSIYGMCLLSVSGRQTDVQ